MSIMKNILAARLNGADKTAPDDNSMLLKMLASFGVTPEKVLEWVRPIIAELSKINDAFARIEANQLTIIQRLTDVESNMAVLLRDHSEDEQIDNFMTVCEACINPAVVCPLHQLRNN